MIEISGQSALYVFGAKCLDCGYDMPAAQFSDGRWAAWPVPCTVTFARSALWHTPGIGWIDADGVAGPAGCGGVLALTAEPAEVSDEHLR